MSFFNKVLILKIGFELQMNGKLINQSKASAIFPAPPSPRARRDDGKFMKFMGKMKMTNVAVYSLVFCFVNQRKWSFENDENCWYSASSTASFKKTEKNKTKEERRRNWKRNFNFELNSSIMAVIKNKTEIVRRLLLFLFKTGINVAVSGNFIEQCGAFSAVL